MSERPSLMQKLDDLMVPVPVLLRILLGGYFVYSGIVKVGDPVIFLKNVNLYDALPHEPAIFLNATAIILPWLEIVCGAVMVVGIWTRGAALNLAVMLAIFTPAILLRALAVSKSDGIPFVDVAFDCGCGSGAVIIWKKLLFNTGLFLVAVLTVVSRCRQWSLASCFSGKPPGN